jgi:hypothetical protein
MCHARRSKIQIKYTICGGQGTRWPLHCDYFWSIVESPSSNHCWFIHQNDLAITSRVDDRMVSEWWIGMDLVGRGRGLILRYYPGIRLEGPRKTTKNLNQDSRSSGTRFETGTFRIRSRSVNHSTTTFDKWLLNFAYEVSLSYSLGSLTYSKVSHRSDGFTSPTKGFYRP